jgi:hypothetical protein
VSLWGFVFLALHPLFFVLASLGNDIIINEIHGVRAGIVSFWIFVFIIFTTLFSKKLKIPYHY